MKTKSQTGQATVEFSLVAIFLVMLLFGILDLGVYFAGRVTVTNATRTAARFAAAHPTAWSNAANPPANTIQGKLVSSAVPATVVNDDTHVTVSYIVPGVGAGTTCGSYRAATNSFVPAAGYTQASCVVAGNLIQVRARYVYTFVTPFTTLIGSSQNVLTIDGSAAELEER